MSNQELNTNNFEKEVQEKLANYNDPKFGCNLLKMEVKTIQEQIAYNEKTNQERLIGIQNAKDNMTRNSLTRNYDRMVLSIEAMKRYIANLQK